jgi:hypothetical protein
MAIALLMEFKGVSTDQYDAVVRAMELGGLPYKGGIFHVAGPTEDGLRIVDVWESQEAFDAFAQAKLMPITQQLGITPPEVKVWPVYNVLR